MKCDVVGYSGTKESRKKPLDGEGLTVTNFPVPLKTETPSRSIQFKCIHYTGCVLSCLPPLDVKIPRQIQSR